jgi:hypothetical protein
MRCRVCSTIIPAKIHRCTYIAAICLDCNSEERVLKPDGTCSTCGSASTMWLKMVNVVRLASVIKKEVRNA